MPLAALTNLPRPRSAWASLWLTALLAGAFHLPLLLSDSVLWDDVTLVHAADAGEMDLMIGQFTDAGSPLWGWMHSRLLDLPSAPRWYKLIALVCIVGATVCIETMLRRDARLADGDARLIALLAAAYPFYSLWHNLITLPYAICYLLFFAGAALYRKHLAAETLFTLAGLAALLLLAISFTIESFGVFFYGIAVWFWLASPAASWRARLAGMAPALCLPPAVFFGKRWLFPMQNAYAGYNRVSLSVSSLLRGLEDFVKRAICDPVEDLAKFSLDEPLFFLSLIVPGLALGVLVARLAPRGEGDRRSPRAMLAAAAMLFFCGAFAYIAVGKPPVLNSYESRHALLIGLPLAIGCLAALRMIARCPWLFRAALALLLAVGFVLQTRSYVRWQNRYIKSRAITENLRDQRAPPGTIILLDDQAPFGMPEKWRTYEVNWMLKQALGNELTSDSTPADSRPTVQSLCPDEAKKRYFGCRDAAVDSEHLDEAPTTRLTVTPTTGLSAAEIYLGYWTASDRASYVKGLVRLEACTNDKTLSALPGPARK